MPNEPMPNSAGCVHAHPSDVAADREGAARRVQRRDTTKHWSRACLPYPYVPQGLAAVFEINGPADAAAYDAWLAAAAAA